MKSIPELNVDSNELTRMFDDLYRMQFKYDEEFEIRKHLDEILDEIVEARYEINLQLIEQAKRERGELK